MPDAPQAVRAGEARPRARAVQYLFLQNKANFPAISRQPPQFFIRTTNPEMPDFADSVKKTA
jgi:hypothetical protein